ncbi:LysR family transcriptional regulator [Roseibium sp.]|uniref:LysR family transcriptional regulator n=1 Tax=Roseibium sp. TaxID=1936156 RepID=UPI003D11A4E9
MTTLAHLETFAEVAACGSFAAAARLLGLPRSTVTARIKALEEDLGVALFRRTTRQVRLTVEGEAYRARVLPALKDLAEAGEQIKTAQTPRGLVRLSVPVDLPLDRMAEAMTSFNARYPDVRIEVHVSDRPVDLTGERFDFALRGNRVASENVVVRKIASGPLISVVHSNHPPEETFETIFRDGRLLDPAGALDETDLEGGPSTFTTRNLQLARALVLAGKVAAILPRAMCADLLASGLLKELECPISLPDLPLFAVLPSRRFVPKRVRLLLDHLVEKLD